MKNQELFDRTVGILVKAYQNDTLHHSNCYACAVGNLVCANMGMGYEKDKSGVVNIKWSGYDRIASWVNVFCTISNDEQDINPFSYLGRAKEEIDATGYSWEDLAKIEYAFETAPFGNSDDDFMFNGLMKVVDILMEIHEANKAEITAAKSLFKKELTEVG